jgi:hypothetical protein
MQYILRPAAQVRKLRPTANHIVHILKRTLPDSAAFVWGTHHGIASLAAIGRGKSRHV